MMTLYLSGHSLPSAAVGVQTVTGFPRAVSERQRNVLRFKGWKIPNPCRRAFHVPGLQGFVEGRGQSLGRDG